MRASALDVVSMPAMTKVLNACVSSVSSMRSAWTRPHLRNELVFGEPVLYICLHVLSH